MWSVSALWSVLMWSVALWRCGGRQWPRCVGVGVQEQEQITGAPRGAPLRAAEGMRVKSQEAGRRQEAGISH
jgi:hypothetical protein